MFVTGQVGSAFVANETLDALYHSQTPWIIEEDCLQLQRVRNKLKEQFQHERYKDAYEVEFYYRTPHNAKSIETHPDVIGYYPRTNTYVMRDFTVRKARRSLR